MVDEFTARRLQAKAGEGAQATTPSDALKLALLEIETGVVDVEQVCVVVLARKTVDGVLCDRVDCYNGGPVRTIGIQGMLARAIQNLTP